MNQALLLDRRWAILSNHELAYTKMRAVRPSLVVYCFAEVFTQPGSSFKMTHHGKPPQQLRDIE